MNKYFLLILCLITADAFPNTVSSTDAEQCQLNPCTDGEREFIALTPFQDPSSKTFKLIIKIKNSYRNAKVYLNSEKLDNSTSNKGEFEYDILAHRVGNNCLKIQTNNRQSLSYSFNFNNDTVLLCEGQDNLCCKEIRN